MRRHPAQLSCSLPEVVDGSVAVSAEVVVAVLAAVSPEAVVAELVEHRV